MVYLILLSWKWFKVRHGCYSLDTEWSIFVLLMFVEILLMNFFPLRVGSGTWQESLYMSSFFSYTSQTVEQDVKSIFV